MNLVVFLKAHQLGLFDQSVNVQGYTRAGRFVQGYTGKRRKRLVAPMSALQGNLFDARGQPVKKVSVETPTPKAEKNRMSLISDLKETCLKFEQEVSRLETKPLSGRFTEERRARYLSEARDRLSAARELLHEFTERGINDNEFEPLISCRYYNPASLIGREDLAQRIG